MTTWHVQLTAEQRRMLRRLIHDEARRLGVEEGMERVDWPPAHRTRLTKLLRIMKKLQVRDDYRVLPDARSSRVLNRTTFD